MFGLVWGPTLAAASVVLDSAADPAAVQRALDCLLLAARLAAYHQVGLEAWLAGTLAACRVWVLEGMVWRMFWHGCGCDGVLARLAAGSSPGRMCAVLAGAPRLLRPLLTPCLKPSS